MFAHAVAAALEQERWTAAFARFGTGGWNHDLVNRFACIQIKKVGGGGTSKANELCTHAAKYAITLNQQMDLYRPHLVLGCGVGQDSPARLLATHVLVGGREAITRETGATWWQFSPAALKLWSNHGIPRGADSGRNATKTSGVPFETLYKRSLGHQAIAAGLRPRQP